MALYNDRVYAYERMVELDNILNQEPDRAGEMVRDDNLNHLAHLELQEYNKHKRFLYKHPILYRYKLEQELEALRKHAPGKFTAELVNAHKSITRYESQIRKKKYRDEEERISWENKISMYKEKIDIMERLIAH